MKKIINSQLIFTCLLILPATSFAGNYSRFHHVPEPLSEITVHESAQTPNGVIWFATELGLYRYDGKSTEKIILEGKGPSSNYLRSIEVTSDGKLWLGYLGSGIALYDPTTGNFERHFYSGDTGNKENFNRVWSLLLASDGNLWIGTYTNGLFHYSTTTGKIEPISIKPIKKKPSETRIYILHEESENTILFGADDGLYEIDTTSKKIHAIKLPPNSVSKSNSASTAVWDIESKDKTSVWLASDNGVYIYNRRSRKAAAVKYINEKLPGQILRSVLYEPEKSRLWVATAKFGLFLTDLSAEKARLFQHNPNNATTLSSNGVFNIYKDKTGLIWISTTKGTNLLDPRTLQYFYWPTKENYNDIETSAVLTLDNSTIAAGIGTEFDVISVPSFNTKNSFTVSGKENSPINTLFRDSNGRVWAGLAYNGLYRVIPATGKTWKLKYFEDKYSTIHEIAEDNNGMLWVATSGQGLLKLDPAKEDITRIDIGNSDNITAIEITKDSIWIGAMDGLYQIPLTNLDKLSTQITAQRITFPAHESQSWIMDITSLGDDILIGSTTSLYKIDKDGNTTLIFGGQKKPTAILSMLPLENGDYWLSTATGLYKFNSTENTFFHYTESQGLPFSAFLPQAASKTDSNIYFGGTEGLLGFPKNAALIRTGSVPVSILNSTIYSDNKARETTSSYRDSITLSPNEKVLQIEFGVMDYLHPDKHKYKYRLMGISERWVLTNNNQATFTHLPPGKYTFEVKGANADGIWSESPDTLRITVTPPWWMTTWAYITYLITFLLLLGCFVWYQNRRVTRIREVNRQLREAEELREHFIDQLEEQVSSATSDLRDSMEALQIKAVELEVANKRAQDASQLKSQFLAHISHELRTPLNGILGFADLLDRTRLDTSQKEYLQTITKSGEGLLLTVNNLLDISKIEAGKVSLETGDFSLQECVSETLVMLAPIALEKHLELCSIIDPELPLYLRGDAARLRQILTNLVGNAIKFTTSGSVTVRILLDEMLDDRARFTLAVSDTGIGITPEQREKLFTSFTQADPGIQRRFGGTGLGLSLCKMLVEAMDGSIDLQSTAGIGTTVSVRLSLPLGNPDEESWQPDARLANATILLYDSHPLSSQGFASLFQGWKASVVETDSLSGLEAELQRHGRQARYAACVVCLDEVQISALREDDSELLRLLMSRRDLPLLVLASTLDMERLCSLEVRFEAACLAKHAGFRTIHQTLVGILNEQPQFSRTLRKLETETDSGLAGTRILIADDNAANRELLQHMLRHAGAHTAEAADGREALARLREEQWDLLLLDIHMPGVSGLEVVSRIRDGRAGDSMLPVIAVTANALPEMQQWARACGMDGYIIKPFTEEQLMSEIERLRKRGE